MIFQSLDKLKGWEGLRLKAYLPTKNDRWTIGYGHTKGVQPSDVITEEKAEDFLREDIQWAVDAVNEHVRVGLNQNQFDALVSFVYNVGEGAFKRSTLLRKLNAGDYEGAANEFPRWNKQKGRILKGLVRRRNAEMEQFLSDNAFARTDREIVPDEVKPLKPMISSKEVIAGSGAILTGGGAFLGSLGPFAQNTISVGLTIALLSFGGFIIWNRIQARKRGER